MANNRMVTHDGKVVGIEGSHVRVKIISQSACAACHAKGACSAADMEEKYIDGLLPPGESVVAGDTVTVTMERKLGWIALFFGFVFPLLVMVSVLFILFALGYNENQAALSGLGSLVPYYLLLYIFRGKVEKDFTFRVEKKNKF